MDIVTYALAKKYTDEHGGGTAADTTYDNTESGLEADNVQDAVDGLSAQKVDKPSAEIPAGYICVSDGQGGCTWVAPAE